MKSEIEAQSEGMPHLWVGWFEQLGTKTPQSMELNFVDRTVTGSGVDELGEFTIEGGFGPPAERGPVGWIKTYVDAHSVLYLGTLDEPNCINGQWCIGDTYSGKFQFRREA